MARLALLAALTGLIAPAAQAYDRARSPIAVAIARTDAAVVGNVTSSELGMPFTKVTIEVERTLLGAAPSKLTVEVDQGWQVGAQVILLARQVEGQWKAVLDGTGLHTAELEAEITARLKTKPAWSKPVDGWSAVLVTTQSSYATGEEIDAYMVYRNASDSGKTLVNREWPPEDHTLVDLVVHRGKTEVAAVDHPHVTKKDIEDYFSKHANDFEIELPPGESWALGLQRINSAKPGWGYKERTGFRYWPMDEAGSYTVAARDVKRGIETAPVTVEVK